MRFDSRSYKFWLALGIVLGSIICFALWVGLATVLKKIMYRIYRYLDLGEFTIILINLFIGLVFMFFIFYSVYKSSKKK